MRFSIGRITWSFATLIIFSVSLMLFYSSSTYQNIIFRRYQKPLFTNRNPENSKCYENRYFNVKSGIDGLGDILLGWPLPTHGKSIFFHESKCSKTGILELNARQACAIESAALLNPNTNIFILFASPVGYYNNGTSGASGQILKTLQSYKNVNFRTVDLWRYSELMAKWVANNIMLGSIYFEQHVGDLLRLLTLYRWGGTVLEFDIILKKSLENMPPNFAAIELGDETACPIINLDKNGIGAKIAKSFLLEIPSTYSPFIEHSIDSYHIVDVLEMICTQGETTLKDQKHCPGFSVLDKDIFFPIGYKNWNDFFNTVKLEEILKLTNDSIAIHLWNEFSHNNSIIVGSKVAYGIYAEKYCPKVYNSCGVHF